MEENNETDIINRREDKKKRKKIDAQEKQNISRIVTSE